MIPFIDLKKQYSQIQSKVQDRINGVLDHGQFIMGPEVLELEQALANYVGTKHAIACSSGTDALLLALMAEGVGPGDEVIIPDFTFFGTAEVVSLLQAKPIPVDVDPKTYNLDVAAASKAVTSKTKAVIPVSLYGQCADFDPLNKIASDHDLAVIEDGAQSFGATYKGRKSGSLCKWGCTSFFPSKPLGAYGDSGALFTNDDELALKAREFLKHGQSKRYFHTSIGLNARMDTMQAAILLEKLAIFDSEFEMRQRVAQLYLEKLDGKVTLPFVEQHNVSAWAQFTIQVDNRDEFRDRLQKQNIPTAVHYPMGISDQPVYQGVYQESFPVTEQVSKRVVSLPFHPYLDETTQNNIVEVILQAVH